MGLKDLNSPEFERFLERYGDEIGVDVRAASSSSLRPVRIRAKLGLVLRKFAVRTGHVAGAAAAISAGLVRNPQVVAAVTVIAGSAEAAYLLVIAWEVHQGMPRLQLV